MTINWRKYTARVGIYQTLRFIAHLTYKRRRQPEEYRGLARGGYLYGWMAEILIRLKSRA